MFGIFSFLILFLSLIIFSGCGPTDPRKKFSDVVEYNDYIVDELELTDALFDELIDNIFNDITLAEKNLKIFQEGADNRLLRLNIQPYEEDSSLCEATKDYLKIISELSKTDMAELIELQKVGEAGYEAALLLCDKIDETRATEHDKVELAQKIFAKKHGVRLN